MKIRRLQLLLTAAVLSGLAVQAQAGTASSAEEITTTTGKTYRDVTILGVEPDGLVVRYQPQPAGLGLAKLKFSNLPESLRKEYGYDPQAAAQFEAQEAKATAQMRSRMQASEPAEHYRAMAELNWALGGDAYTSYSVSLDRNGKVSAQGYTGDAAPPFIYYYYSESYPAGYNAPPPANTNTGAQSGQSGQGGY